MAENDEKFEGTFNGEEISIFREVSGHRLTDEEVAALLDGKVICFSATSRKSGNEFNAICKLAKNDKGFYRCVMDFDLTPDIVFSQTPPYKWCGYEFSKEEREALKRGERVDGTFTWRSGKTGPATVEWVDEDGSGLNRVRPIFDN